MKWYNKIKPSRPTTLIAAGTALVLISGVGAWAMVPGLPGHHHRSSHRVAHVDHVGDHLAARIPMVTIHLPVVSGAIDVNPPPVPTPALDGEWVNIDSDDFHIAGQIMDANRVIVNDPPKPLPTAYEVQRMFLADAGSTVLYNLGLTPERLEGHYMTSEELHARMLRAVQAVRSTKLAMVALAELSTQVPAESSAKYGDPRPVETYWYESSLKYLSKQLKDRLTQLGDEIAAGEPGITANSPGSHHIMCMVDYGNIPDGNEKMRKVLNGDHVEGLPTLNFPVRTADGVVTSCP